MLLDYPDPELRIGGVRLRKWQMTDLNCVEEASTDASIPEDTTVPAGYTDAEGRAFVERQHSRVTRGQGLSLAIADARTNEARGLVYLGMGSRDGHCRIGYWVVPAARRRGLATAAVQVVSRWVLSETGIYRISAIVEPTNQPSVSVLNRCGFRLEGEMRRYLRIGGDERNVALMALLDTDLD